jgi:pyrroline-5-carboxylate reductase
MRIAFIGGGNMASGLVGGLLSRGWPAGDLVAADPSAVRRQALIERFGLRATADNAAAAREAEVIVLSVKPQQMRAVAQELAPSLQDRRRLVISIAAGIRLADLVNWLGPAAAVVRTMPNRPALIGAGVTALLAHERVSPEERAAAESILAACGATVWIESEEQMDTVTAVSGSGPAYFFLLTEALEEAGIRLGLPPGTARLLAVETARGAGRLAAESGEAPATLREQVTSKGGTTAAALGVMNSADLSGIVARAVAAAARRSAELAGPAPD